MTDCEFCKESKSQYLVRFYHGDSELFISVKDCGKLTIYDSEYHGKIERYIRFCPMCGRKFEHE